MNREAALQWHFGHNMIPRMPSLIPAAKEAIQAMKEDDPERLIDVSPAFPGWEKASGGKPVYTTAWEFVEDYKLEAFLEGDDDAG